MLLPGLKKEGSSVSREAQVAVGTELVAMWYPRSAVAEQYRVAATRLGLVAGKQKSTVVSMASALMGEGKTSTALNMAYVLARDLNRKTVLVDCDLKKPMVHAYAGMESTAGLTEVLLGHKTLDECLEYHEPLGIWVLPAGIEDQEPPRLRMWIDCQNLFRDFARGLSISCSMLRRCCQLQRPC